MSDYAKLRPLEEHVRNYLSLVFAMLILFIISGAAYRLFSVEYVLPIGVALIMLLLPLFFPIGSHTRTTAMLADWLLGVLGFIAGIYAIWPAIKIHWIGRLVVSVPLHEFVLGIIMVVLLLEYTRRTAGVALTVILILFLLYAFVSGHLPLYWTPKPVDPAWFVSFMYLGHVYYGATEGIFGRLTELTINVISGFLLFGGIMVAVGLGDFIIDLFKSVTGWMSGGVAKVSIWASALFGTITGSPVAEVMAIGSITIPAMIATGFENHIAAAIEAAAGCGGELMPPIMGAGAFIMSEILGIPYVEIAAAAVLPAILYFFTKFTAIHYYAKAKGLKGLPRSELPSFKGVLSERWPLIVPLLVLIILLPILPSIMWVAFWSIVVAVIVPNIKRSTRVKYSKLYSGVVEAVKSLVSIGVIIIAADIAAAVMATTGLAVAVSNALISISGGRPIIALVIAMIGALILGMLVPATAAYIFAAVTFAYPLIELGLNPLAVHMFLFYFAIMGPITPPVALATYAASGIAKSDFWKSGVWGVVFALVGFIVPYIFVYDTSLLLVGSVTAIILRFLLVALGSTTLAGAIFGYFFAHLGLWERIAYGITSALIIYPDSTYFLNAVGVVFFAVISLVHGMRARKIF